MSNLDCSLCQGRDEPNANCSVRCPMCGRYVRLKSESPLLAASRKQPVAIATKREGGKRMAMQRTLKNMQKQCDDFNARYLVGQSIKFWTGPREGNPTHEGPIRFAAEVMGGHTPVVWVEGKGSIALSHVAGPALSNSERTDG